MLEKHLLELITIVLTNIYSKSYTYENTKQQNFQLTLLLTKSKINIWKKKSKEKYKNISFQWKSHKVFHMSLVKIWPHSLKITPLFSTTLSFFFPLVKQVGKNYRHMTISVYHTVIVYIRALQKFIT